MTAVGEGDEQEGRLFSRLSAMIPVRVEIAQPWQGAAAAALPGGLLDVSCGGAGLRLRCVLPPRTRLFISVPEGNTTRRLLGEVIWTSSSPDRSSAAGLYGVRWVESLSPEVVDALLMRVRTAGTGEVADGSGD